MRALILCYSLYGTTRRVADSIAGGLTAAGYQVDIQTIQKDRSPDLAGYDLVGVGAPVYYFKLPIHVMQMIRLLPPLKTRPVFGFMTYGSVAWNAGQMLHDALEAAGGNCLGVFMCRGNGVYYPYNRQGWLASHGHPDLEDLSAAVTFGTQVGQGQQLPVAAAGVKPPPLVYWLEQRMTAPVIIRGVLQRLFRLHKHRCIRCGRCAAQCPVANIRLEDGGYPRWGHACILCLNCEAVCPKEAIVSPLSWRVIQPMIRYNVRGLQKDPAIELVRVRHRYGRLKYLDEPNQNRRL